MILNKKNLLSCKVVVAGIQYQRYMKDSPFVMSLNVMCVGIIPNYSDYLLNTFGITRIGTIRLMEIFVLLITGWWVINL